MQIGKVELDSMFNDNIQDKPLNRDVIKYIAMVTMLLNHIADIFLNTGISKIYSKILNPIYTPRRRASIHCRGCCFSGSDQNLCGYMP